MDQDEFNLKVSESLGRIENKIDGLTGPGGSVGALSNRLDSLESDRTRNWWFTVVFAPVIAAISATLRHFGIHV